MKFIKDGIVFSNDIKRILNGINAFDYKYDVIPNNNDIENVRKDFLTQTNKIFKGKVSIISEEQMLEVNKFIGGEYPHCNS